MAVLIGSLRFHASKPKRLSGNPLVLRLLLFLLLVAGCDGCWPGGGGEPAPAVPEIAMQPLHIVPDDVERMQRAVKPGHWMAGYQDWRSASENHRGELRIEPAGGEASTSIPVARPAVLSRGQNKRFDVQVFVPRRLEGGSAQGNRPSGSATLNSEFVPRGRGLSVRSAEPVQRMHASEYLFVVLTQRPSEFNTLRSADWAQSRFDGVDAMRHYRVTIPTVAPRVAVPHRFLDCTSIAYLLWDDLPPQRLTSGQQEAIADWVRWGGGLIVNGPVAAEALADSPLGELLPIEVQGVRELPAASLESLVSAWSVADDPDAVANIVGEGEARLRLEGPLRRGAAAVEGTEDLVVQWRAGRGHVVLCRMDLTGRWLSRWRSLPSFYNAVLMRRPPREYAEFQELRLAGPLASLTDDPRLITPLRIFARDGRIPAAAPPSDTSDSPHGASGAATPRGGGSPGDARGDRPPRPAAEEVARWLDETAEPHAESGIAGWSEESGASLAAAELLRSSAGITVPRIDFIARFLAFYLVIVVPINFTIFALLGRLEWAWIAAPIFAVLGAVWVARAAQLDIGFARSQTELALLEIQGGYDRGHHSRYVALYNSLATNYTIHLEDEDAAAMPMTAWNAASSRRPVLRHAADGGVALEGFQLGSNQTSLLHTEAMVPLGGTLSWDEATGVLTNDTLWTLRRGALVWRTSEGQTHVRRIESLPAGGRVDVGRLPQDRPVRAERHEEHDGFDGLEGLAARVADPGGIEAGEARLVALGEGDTSALEVQPPTSQQRRQTLVLAHLRHRSLPPPQPDRNLRPIVSEDEELGAIVLEDAP